MIPPQILFPLVYLAIISIVAYVIIQFIKSRRKERSQMIEKGMNPYQGVDIETFNKKSNLKNGVVLVSLGLGLFVGQMMLIQFENLDGFITYLTSTLICGGIGFLITYRLMKRLH